jgi:hypothetical protein
MTQYLDFDALEAIDAREYRTRKPYPWISLTVLTDEGFEALRKNLPDLSLFEQSFGYQRVAGQQPHDRYSLEYREDIEVPAPWRDFIAELRSDRYRNAIARLFNARKPEFRFHWHYAPNGCSVSPHCDSKREYGSHLFYFNTEEDWDPAWGGETLVLDDGGSLKVESAPAFEDFEREIACPSMGNVSSILRRSDRSWHGVREIHCPEDRMRKIFIVVVNPSNLYWKVRDRLIGKSIQRF